MSTEQMTPERVALLELHDWDELIFGGFYCLHCTPDDEFSLDDPIAWPCQPLREAGVTLDDARQIIMEHRAKVEARHRAEYEAKLEADKAEGQRRADAFNARFPIGTPVMAYPGIRPEDPVAVAYRKAAEAGRTFRSETDPCKRLVTTTRTPAWILGHGAPVVSVDGYAGGICLDHIDVIGEVSAS